MSPSLACCGIDLSLEINKLEDELSWQARCPACGNQYWLELIGVVEEIHIIPEDEWTLKLKEPQKISSLLETNK
jgi:hypothetical protein